MNIGKIKYCVAVAAVMVATAFCGCDSKEEEIIEIKSTDMQEEDTAAPKLSEEAATTVSEKTVRVYVCGAVRSPDVYELPASSRMTDAVEAAGGFEKDAAKEYLNLAAILSDGQKVYIPTNTEIEEALAEGMELYGAEVNITTNSPGIKSAGDGNTDGNPGGTNASGLVNINQADKSTLMTLPGIGESKADKIIEYRQNNGGFTSIEDIMLVGGIKEGLFNKVKDKICVE